MAKFYKGLLDSGAVENRAALARYLGVSRSRIETNRLSPITVAYAVDSLATIEGYRVDLDPSVLTSILVSHRLRRESH